MPTVRTVIRIGMAAAAIAAFTLASPQASASDGTTTIAGVKVSPKANKETLRIAAADTGALQVTANVCGSSYSLYNAERLPTDANRLGTLFTYTNGGAGPSNFTCIILDNNTGTTKWMKVKLCENKVTSPRCDTDEGNFSQYAGPVYMDNCATRTALMKNSSSSTTYLINAVRGSVCN